MGVVHKFIFGVLLSLLAIQPVYALAEEKSSAGIYGNFAFPPHGLQTEYGDYTGCEVEVTSLVFMDSPYQHAPKHVPLALQMGKNKIFVMAGLFVLALVAALYACYIAIRHRVEKSARMSNERYTFVMNESDAALMDFDSNRRVLAYSESATRILDIPADTEEFHASYRACIHPDDYDEYIEIVDRMYAGDSAPVAMELRMRIPSGEYHYFLAKAKCLLDDDNKPRVCALVVDINDQKLLEMQIERSLSRDSLTDVYNRVKFISACDEALSCYGNMGYALLCLDIDSFTKINNLCGFDAGDSVLRQVSSAVRRRLPAGALFGRLGNDDFAVLLRVGTPLELHRIFSEIADETAKISVELLIRIPVRIHGGYAFLEEHDNILSVLTKAVAAQKVASENGEELVNYEQGVRYLTIDRDELTEDLRGALETSELEMWYQPEIDLKTGKLYGMEALMRWRHPRKGDVPPSIFIALAEESGFIGKLDAWALQEACRQNKRWQEMGYPPVHVSVNASKAQIKNGELVESIHTALEVSGLEGRYLTVELTESLAVSNPEQTIKTLNELKQMGVTVSMDDFGSGYASLGTLKMLPFDTLKIDRSLIMDVDKNETGQQIAAAIVGIARSVKLQVVAEGAETLGQVEYLQSIGCDIVQGYYYGEPVSAKHFERYFAKFL